MLLAHAVVAAFPWSESAEACDRHTRLRIELAEATARPRRLAVVFRAFEAALLPRYTRS